MTDMLIETVRSRWCEVLDVAHAAEDDDFFRSGGHSLLAVRLTAALREDFGVRVPIAAIFETRTLGAFADRVAGLVQAEASTVGG
jgi:acyl carrier protein